MVVSTTVEIQYKGLAMIEDDEEVMHNDKLSESWSLEQTMI